LFKKNHNKQLPQESDLTRNETTTSLTLPADASRNLLLSFVGRPAASQSQTQFSEPPAVVKRGQGRPRKVQTRAPKQTTQNLPRSNNQNFDKDSSPEPSNVSLTQKFSVFDLFSQQKNNVQEQEEAVPASEITPAIEEPAIDEPVIEEPPIEEPPRRGRGRPRKNNPKTRNVPKRSHKKKVKESEVVPLTKEEAPKRSRKKKVKATKNAVPVAEKEDAPSQPQKFQELYGSYFANAMNNIRQQLKQPFRFKAS